MPLDVAQASLVQARAGRAGGDMRAILLTSTFRRHVFVANTVAAALRPRGRLAGREDFRPERYAQDADGRGGHPARISRAATTSEARYFACDRARPLGRGAVHRMVVGGRVQRSGGGRADDRARPDVVLVFGTGILREPLLSAFAGRIINIHLGLSPYYRGAGTNFWPLVNREPEYVGATIHYLDAGIDTGPILAHARPAIARGDGPHDIGNKTIVAAARGAAAGGGRRTWRAPRARCRSGAAAGSISERTSAPTRCARCTATSRQA